MNTPRNPPPHLDALLTTAEAAEWFGISKAVLLAKTKGRRPAIPAVRLNKGLIRFNPRMILATMMDREGMPLDLIAASFGASIAVKDRENHGPLKS